MGNIYLHGIVVKVRIPTLAIVQSENGTNEFLYIFAIFIQIYLE